MVGGSEFTMCFFFQNPIENLGLFNTNSQCDFFYEELIFLKNLKII